MTAVTHIRPSVHTSSGSVPVQYDKVAASHLWIFIELGFPGNNTEVHSPSKLDLQEVTNHLRSCQVILIYIKPAATSRVVGVERQ
jgi:hypothetical protein